MSYMAISRFNLNPDPKRVKSFGVLTYVSDAERREILNLPSGCFKPRIKTLEKELKDAQKLEKERLARQKAAEAATLKQGGAL